MGCFTPSMQATCTRLLCRCIDRRVHQRLIHFYLQLAPTPGNSMGASGCRRTPMFAPHATRPAESRGAEGWHRTELRKNARAWSLLLGLELKRQQPPRAGSYPLKPLDEGTARVTGTPQDLRAPAQDDRLLVCDARRHGEPVNGRRGSPRRAASPRRLRQPRSDAAPRGPGFLAGRCPSSRCGPHRSPN